MSCEQEIKFSQSSAAGSSASNSAAIIVNKRTGGGFYITPPPQIGWSENPVIQGNHLLGYETTVTLSCFAVGCSSTSNLGQLVSVQSFFEDATTLEVRSSASQSGGTTTFNITNPRVSVQPSNFAGVTRYDIVFDSFSPSDSTKGAITSETHGNTSNKVAIPLASFSDVFSYEPDDSLGKLYDDPGAQVYRFTRTCSAKGRPAVGADVNNSSTFYANACSGVKAFVDSRMAINEYSPYVVTDHYKYIQGASIMRMSTAVNIDLAELSYSVTINGYWANSSGGTLKQLGAFETFNTTVQNDASSRLVSVTVDGKLNGYSIGAPTDSRQSVLAGAGGGAQDVLNRISGNGSYGMGSVVYSRAQSACGSVLNAIPKSISVADSASADGAISYNITYDNRPTNVVTGSISESISVSDSYPTDVYASIQIMGKRDGPVFQYMNTTTEYERTLNVELIMSDNITASPSVHSDTRDQINSLISNAAPSPSSAGYVMLKQATENWNSTEGQYSLNMSWAYK